MAPTLSPPALKPESREFMKLVTTGRKTGLPHIVIVRYALFDGAFHVLAGREASDWFSNAAAAGSAKVRLDGFVYEAVARPAGEADKTKAIDAFSRKYGARLVREWYSGTRLCLKLIPLGPPSSRGAAGGEQQVRTDFKSWKAERVGYYTGLVEAFDSAAEEYDFTINQNFINRWIRQRSVNELLGLTRSDDTLLEIGCGTGAEAVEIVRNVSKIIATDISDRMIGILQLKVNARKLEDRIVPFKARASEVSKISSLLGGGRVRVAYSFNGALNCEPEIDRFPDELSKVMQPGGLFVCSIRNSLCLSEAVLHALALQFGKISPRKRQPIMVSVGGIDIPSYYYRPAEFVRIFNSHFKLRSLIGLPSLLPPAYLSDRYVKVRRTMHFVERLEEVLSPRYPFNRFGDQSLFVFQKRD